MTDEVLQRVGNVNGNWFGFKKVKSGQTYKSIINSNGKKYMYEYIDELNIKNYYIYKLSGKQKEVSLEDFMEFKYIGYIFFNKSVYNKKNIDSWINYFNNFGGVNYMDRPTPPFSPEKIIIKK